MDEQTRQQAFVSALVAFGFVAQVARQLDPFVAAVLPALFVLGELTFAAMLRNTMENLVLLGRMQRIRRYYGGLVPEAEQFFDPAETDAQMAAAMATVGMRPPLLQLLFTGASVVAAINSMLGGVGLALLVARLWHGADAAALLIGVAVALLVFGLHLWHQQRRTLELRLRL